MSKSVDTYAAQAACKSTNQKNQDSNNSAIGNCAFYINDLNIGEGWVLRAWMQFWSQIEQLTKGQRGKIYGSNQELKNNATCLKQDLKELESLYNLLKLK